MFELCPYCGDECVTYEDGTPSGLLQCPTCLPEPNRSQMSRIRELIREHFARKDRLRQYERRTG